ncbi:M56 family metallopeptidase [Flavobacterium succinicans]|uniref:BlaR1 peptidase M56 n=1 Tax=Flavobacterium succinicans TaxID=29536 RepID=A0A199XQW1_9FLAO|nr:M56 family metallopeptidase [Flavobacterium succinicans]OAZ04035.1 BlaR1 peptidase M56 [Flavobacterium succinicans]
MTQYLLTSTIAATILLVVYQLFLEKEKMHRFNRFYLLTSLLFSLLIPFISIEIIKEITTPVTTPIPMRFSEGTMIIAEETNYLEQTLWGIYVLVTAILTFRFTRNIITFYQLKKNNTTLTFQNATLVLLQEPVLPHTFMNYIFINEAEYQERKIEIELFAHEMTHVNQKHTLDVLFVELIKAVFWFNPLFILYKKAIQLNHEFLADEKVVQSYQNIPFYQSLLLSKASCNPPLYLASNLNFQVTKKRFLMMSRNSSKKMILSKQLALLPIFTALFCYFCIDSVAQIQPKTNINTKYTVASSNDRDVYYAGVLVNVTDKKRNITFSKKYEDLTLEEKNRYLSYTPKKYSKKIPTKAEFEDFKNSKKYAIWIDGMHTSNSHLEVYSPDKIAYFTGSFIHKNARSKKFPQPFQYSFYTEAYYDKHLKNAHKKFSGKSIDIVLSDTKKSPKNSKTNTKEESLVSPNKNLANLNPGPKTETLINLLQESTKEHNPPVSNDVVFNVAGITEKPEFPGGMEKFYQFVGNNFQTPTVTNLKGKVYVMFIIEKDGSITNASVLRDIGHGTGEEAIRVIKLSPKWIPAQKDGVPVRVQYSLPITIMSSNS